MIWRSEPGAPTLTTPTGAAPANRYVVPPMTALGVGCDTSVIDPAPSATELSFDAFAPSPIATALAPLAVAFVPAASELIPLAPSLL